jgi:ribonuclease HI
MFKLFTDGGARGNPGPAGIGAIIQDSEGNVVAEISEYIGTATNNCAEYTALMKGLAKALALGCREIACFLDSELVVKQLHGQYKVKNKDLAKLFVQVHNLRLKFKKITFSFVPREKNKHADKLVNKALDKAGII